jgi:hypothetical protein
MKKHEWLTITAMVLAVATLFVLSFAIVLGLGAVLLEGFDRLR